MWGFFLDRWWYLKNYFFYLVKIYDEEILVISDVCKIL